MKAAQKQEGLRAGGTDLGRVLPFTGSFAYEMTS